MFKRNGVYFVLPGTTCCACRGGSSVYVFTAAHPLQPFVFRGEVAANTSQSFDAHSPYNWVTNAQASAVFTVGHPPEETYVWLGNQWTTSQEPGRPRNHDLLYFWPIQFRSDGNISHFEYRETVEVQL